MITVKHLLQSKQKSFNVISPDTLVIDALNLLNSVNLSYLVVMKDNKYRGIFSERDYTRNVILKGRTSHTTAVENVMTTDLPMVELSDTLEDCMNLMNSYRCRYLLVFDNEGFLGVITIHDILRQIITSKEEVFDHQLTSSLIDREESNRIY
jgi:signal-transduction protein with cAMP-binding, CBS, and nucleotidyltransferase domain